MTKTFDILANKAPKFGFSLIKREDFNGHEEDAAATMEAKASTGMSRTLHIPYGLRRKKAKKAQGAMFFFSLRDVADYLRNDARPLFNICKKCLVEMKRLDTCEGDPEGIRHDSKCPKCGDIYGSTKFSQFLLRTKHGSRDPKWKPLVANDPPSFSLDSNWLRSTINLLRENKNDATKIVEILDDMNFRLNNQAQLWNENRKDLIEAGEIAG